MTTRWYPDEDRTLHISGTGNAQIYHMDAMEMNCIEE